MTSQEKPDWFTHQTSDEAYYQPNRRTKFVNIILPSVFGDNDDRGWRKVTNFVFGWTLSVPIFVISCLWERSLNRLLHRPKN